MYCSRSLNCNQGIFLCPALPSPSWLNSASLKYWIPFIDNPLHILFPMKFLANLRKKTYTNNDIYHSANDQSCHAINNSGCCWSHFRLPRIVILTISLSPAWCGRLGCKFQIITKLDRNPSSRDCRNRILTTSLGLHPCSIYIACTRQWGMTVTLSFRRKFASIHSTDWWSYISRSLS